MNAVSPILQNTSRTAELVDARDRDRFANVNLSPFGFRHRLALELPLTVTDLIALSERLPDGDAFKGWQNGITGISDGWNQRPAERLTLADTLAGIETNNSLVVLKHIEQDDIIGPVLRDLLQDMFDCSSRRFREDVIMGECLVFLNSPGRMTAYHFDLEASFLLQLAGSKTVYAWPCGDRAIVPESEIAAYCGAGNLSAAVYKPDLRHLAQTYYLEPGDGVHFPSLGPHCVQNGDSVSISINVNYDVRSLHGSLRHVYAFNQRAAKLGVKAGQPGTRPLADKAKAKAWIAALGAKSAARRILGRRRSGEGYPIWEPRNTNA
ncbi:hypothetical protein [Novosphingobium sp.]|uniref:hypothetical protein n=1 Tax=Novosphingobium sp. TaxID=1874826 RepID=UPI0025D79E4A|nr:hypothetical protein [Novosphingobium sp.]